MRSSAGLIDRLNLSEVGQAMLVAGLVLLVSAIALLFSAQGELRQQNTKVQRSNTALLQIAEINSLVIGIDYSARGYALTGQQLFLDHENQKQQRLKQAVIELAGLVEDDMRPAVLNLSNLVDRHAAVYSRFVAMGPGRTKEIAAIITNPVERQKRYDVLNALDVLHRRQLASLYAHQATAEQQLRYSSILTFLIVAISFLGGTTEVMTRMFGRRRKRSAEALPG